MSRADTDPARAVAETLSRVRDEGAEGVAAFEATRRGIRDRFGDSSAEHRASLALLAEALASEPRAARVFADLLRRTSELGWGDPEHAAALHSFARHLRLSGEPVHAEIALRWAWAVSGGPPPPLLAECVAKAAESHRAYYLFGLSLRAGPTGLIHEGRARCATLMGEGVAAAAAFGEASEAYAAEGASRASRDALHRRGDVLGRMGRVDEAAEVFEQTERAAAAKAPEAAWRLARQARIRALLLASRFEEATCLADEAVAALEARARELAGTALGDPRLWKQRTADLQMLAGVARAKRHASGFRPLPKRDPTLTQLLEILETTGPAALPRVHEAAELLGSKPRRVIVERWLQMRPPPESWLEDADRRVAAAANAVVRRSAPFEGWLAERLDAIGPSWEEREGGSRSRDA